VGSNVPQLLGKPLPVDRITELRVLDPYFYR